jgi:hypothetical protein
VTLLYWSHFAFLAALGATAAWLIFLGRVHDRD